MRIRGPIVVLVIVCLVMVCAAPAMALDLPTRKPGLWELKTIAQSPGAPPQVVQHCTDAATDKEMQSFGSSMSAEMCPKQEVRREGDSIIMDSVCRLGPVTMRTLTATTGDFNSAYTTKTTSKQEGGPKIPGMGGESVVTIEARWTGPCQAGQRPGDVIMANGMKMNIGDMKKFMPGGAPQR